MEVCSEISCNFTTEFSDRNVGENKTVLEIIGVIVALTMLFSKLTDLFGIADEFEEGARAIKWTGITLAIIAISGIFSYISSLVNKNVEIWI